MTIKSEIERIKGNITESYAQALLKGAEAPANMNSDNLPATIESIPTGGQGGGETINAINLTGHNIAKGQKVWLNNTKREIDKTYVVPSFNGDPYTYFMGNHEVWTIPYGVWNLIGNNCSKFEFNFKDAHSIAWGRVLREKDGGLSLSGEASYTSTSFKNTYVDNQTAAIGEKYFYKASSRSPYAQALYHVEEDNSVTTILDGNNALTNLAGTNMVCMGAAGGYIYYFKNGGWFNKYKLVNGSLQQESWGYFDDVISSWGNRSNAYMTDDGKFAIIFTDATSVYGTGRVYVFKYNETANKYEQYNLPNLTNGEEQYARIFFDTMNQAFTYSKESDQNFLAFYQYKNGEWIAKQYNLDVKNNAYQAISFSPDMQSFVYGSSYKVLVYTPASDANDWLISGGYNTLNDEKTLVGTTTQDVANFDTAEVSTVLSEVSQSSYKYVAGNFKSVNDYLTLPPSIFDRTKNWGITFRIHTGLDYTSSGQYYNIVSEPLGFRVNSSNKFAYFTPLGGATFDDTVETDTDYDVNFHHDDSGFWCGIRKRGGTDWSWKQISSSSATNSPLEPTSDVNFGKHSSDGYFGACGYFDLSSFSLKIEDVKVIDGSKITPENPIFTINGNAKIYPMYNGELSETYTAIIKKNFYTIGNPSIDSNGIISNISNHNYIKTKEAFLPGDKNWTIELKVKTSEVLDGQALNKLMGQLPKCNFWTPQIELAKNNHFWYGISTTGTSWYSGSFYKTPYGRTKVEPNTIYTIKIIYEKTADNFTIRCLLAKDGEDFIEDNLYNSTFAETSSKQIAQDSAKSIICLGTDQEGAGDQWKGLIYLADCHIDIDGSRWLDFAELPQNETSLKSPSFDV